MTHGPSPFPGLELSLKLGTYKPASVCDIPAIAKLSAWCICRMARLPIDTDNHMSQKTGLAVGLALACAA